MAYGKGAARKAFGNATGQDDATAILGQGWLTTW